MKKEIESNDPTTLRQALDRVPSSPALPPDSPAGVRAPAAPISAHGIEGVAFERSAGRPLAEESPAGFFLAGLLPNRQCQKATRVPSRAKSATASRTTSDLDREHLLLTIPEAARLARLSPRSIQRQIKARPAWALRFGAARRSGSPARCSSAAAMAGK